MTEIALIPSAVQRSGSTTFPGVEPSPPVAKPLLLGESSHANDPPTKVLGSQPEDAAVDGTAKSAAAGQQDSSAEQLERQQLIDTLKARDTQVRQHEAAHLAAAGSDARGGPSYTYEAGPDGRQYAVGGQVQIDTSPVRGDPRATIDKARRIRRAALAPADPSGQDRAVALRAAAMETRAQEEMTTRQAETAADGAEALEQSGTSEGGKRSQPAVRGNPAQRRLNNDPSYFRLARLDAQAGSASLESTAVDAGLPTFSRFEVNESFMMASSLQTPEQPSAVERRLKSYERLAEPPSTGQLGCSCGSIH
jgi:hypothetical protein